MNYPQYPKSRSRITHSNTKKTSGELLQDFKTLSQLNLFVLPKRKTGKLPVMRWQKLTTPLTEEQAVSFQQRDDVSGWVVLTGSRSNNLYVVDIDPAVVESSPEFVYNFIQKMSTTSFVLQTPANGVHLYYKIPSNLKMLRNRTNVIPGVDGRGEGGLVVSLGGFNLYEGKNAEHKGVSDGHEADYRMLVDGNYTKIPEMSSELYDWLDISKRKIAGSGDAEQSNEKRAYDHFKQSVSRREQVVIECLDAIFNKWGNSLSYDEWVQVWMSAHHGSNSLVVRDFILNHPSLVWSDGDDGKEHFIKVWATHKTRKGGYTVKSLFWFARKAGWLGYTGYEIPKTRMTSINVQYISDWTSTLETIPKRCLLISQTGSGKTGNIKTLFYRLGQPKTVIFVPSIKLATELASTLSRSGLPVTLYRDPITGKTRDGRTLQQAKVLVTTLQTFIYKVYGAGVSLDEYGLVYIEESDTLFSQFSRGGGGFWASHVSEHEARSGVHALRDAFEKSEVVWCVDATATQVTLSFMETTSEEPVIVVYNERIKHKAPVHFLNSKAEAHQTVLSALLKDNKVVVATDTAIAAEEVAENMMSLGVITEKECIVITKRHANQRRVKEFMLDVNKNANKYKLVVYNSVMGSGVSITEIVPDVIVQIATYLPPRMNLQILNRYRRQKEVYCYYKHKEIIYTHTKESLLEEAKLRVDTETHLIHLPTIHRTDNAKLRAHVGAISIADEKAQSRSPVIFYGHLLSEDGRQVDFQEVSASDALKINLDNIKDLLQDKASQIAANWHTVRPITKNNPADKDMSDYEIALGTAHGELLAVLKTLPDLNVYDPSYVYKVVRRLRKYFLPLTALVFPTDAVKRAESFLLDGDKSILSIRPNILLINVLSKVAFLYKKGLTEVLTPDIIENRASIFVRELLLVKDQYDLLVKNTQKFDKIYDTNDICTSAIRFAKILLAKAGLKQRQIRSSRKSYHIANFQEVKDFLEWRFGGNIGLQFSALPKLHTETTGEVFNSFTEEQRQEVMKLLKEVDFSKAVNIVYSRYSVEVNI